MSRNFFTITPIREDPAPPSRKARPRLEKRRLTPRQVKRLRTLYFVEGLTLADLALRFSISVTAVWKICHRISYADIP